MRISSCFLWVLKGFFLVWVLFVLLCWDGQQSDLAFQGVTYCKLQGCKRGGTLVPQAFLHCVSQGKK